MLIGTSQKFSELQDCMLSLKNHSFFSKRIPYLIKLTCEYYYYVSAIQLTVFIVPTTES